MPPSPVASERATRDDDKPTEELVKWCLLQSRGRYMKTGLKNVICHDARMERIHLESAGHTTPATRLVGGT